MARAALEPRRAGEHLGPDRRGDDDVGAGVARGVGRAGDEDGARRRACARRRARRGRTASRPRRRWRTRRRAPSSPSRRSRSRGLLRRDPRRPRPSAAARAGRRPRRAITCVGRRAERRRQLGGVERAEAPAGAGADVEEPPAGAQRRHHALGGARDLACAPRTPPAARAAPRSTSSVTISSVDSASRSRRLADARASVGSRA